MAGERWQLQRLVETPLRLGFSAAALVLMLASSWWLAWMLARAFGLAWPWAVAPGLVHGLLFGFGFMPLFFAGFLFTAGPKWLRVPAPDVRVLRLPVALQLLGWLLFLLGAHLQPLLAVFGLTLAALAWLALVHRFTALLRCSQAPERTHLRAIAAAAWLGAGVQLAAAAALFAGRDDLVRAALQLGLWGFVAPVFMAALHRMLPVFDDEVAPRLAARHPHWLLATLVLLCLLQWPFALAELWWWPQPPAWRALQIVLDGAAALLLFSLAARWLRLQGGARLPLIAMLQAGVLWLGVAFALAALSQALQWTSAGRQPLGLASPHAFTMGFLATVMLAMVTRVASGQAGRSIAADAPAWAMFLMLQLAVLLRVAAALADEARPLLVAAALAFVLALLPWGLRLLGWFGRAARAH